MRRRLLNTHSPLEYGFTTLCDRIIEYSRLHHSMRPPTLLQQIIDRLKPILAKATLDQCMHLHQLFKRAGLTHISGITLPLQEQAIQALLNMHPYTRGHYQDHLLTSALKSIDRMQSLMRLTLPYKSIHALHFQALAQAINNDEPPPSRQDTLHDTLMRQSHFK